MNINAKTEIHGEREYRVFAGVYYNKDTSDEIILHLHNQRVDGTRLRFHWGDIKTGRDWGDSYDVKGRIGLSTGPIKIPILIYNRRSMGGGGILTGCIVKITETKGGYVVYQHPKYHTELGREFHKICDGAGAGL